VNRGFQTENRLLFSVSMPGAYRENSVGKHFVDRFLGRLSTVPGIVAVGAVSHRPVEGRNAGMGIDSSARPPSPGQSGPPRAGWRIVSPGYFRAIGLPLLRGRIFDDSDRPVWAEPGEPDPPRRVIISDRLAKLIFPNEDPIGKHVILWKGQGNLPAEVIGVVGDSRERGLAADPALTVFIPYGPRALTSEFVVHTQGNPLAVIPTVRSIVNSLDPNLPIAGVRTFEEVVRRSIAPRRLNAVLLALFSGLALLLATTGIYGVLSYSVSRRTSEIGLRIALGASGGDIIRMAIGQGMRPALVGIALGALGAWWLSRYFTTLLFGIKPFDSVTYAAVAFLLLATALMACYLPGRRAMRTDPTVALRTE
jgi:putative ABC transport system permease protein